MIGNSGSAIRKFFVLFVLLGSWLGPSVTEGQSKLEEGESVRVLYLGTWFDGIVLGKDKKFWGVEFTFANSPKREYFDRVNIRKLCEVDALDFSKSWESKSGKFKVDAALKSVDGADVVLIKTDLSEVKVPLDSLSDKDVSYVNKLKKNRDAAVARGDVPATVPTLPEIEEFAPGFSSSPSIAFGQGEIVSFGATPSFLKDFRQAGTGFRMARVRQELVAAIPVGGPEQLVLMTAREDSFFHRDNPFQSQVYWVSLKQKKVLGSVAITPEDYVVDYNPRQSLMLSVRREDQSINSERDVFTLWKMKPGELTAQPINRWFVKVEGWPNSIFAKIITDKIVLSKTDRQTYVAWDLETKKELYAFKAASFFDARVVLTLDRKNLIVPEDGKVTVINAESGELLFSVAVEDRHVSAANINSEGTRLVALTEKNVYVWDLRSQERAPKVYSAPLIGSPFQSRIEWVDDDHVLADSHRGRVLFRLSLALPVWSYEMDVREYFLNQDPLKNMVINGLFFYVAQPSLFDGSIAVGAVDFPGPSVNEVTKEIDKEKLWIVKSGVPVGVEIVSVSDPGKVTNWLKEKITENGWIYDEQAEIKLYAEMGVGKPQTETYREMGIGGKTTTVSFTPYFASLQMKKGDLIIWQSGSSTGAPPIVSGENIQSAVSSYQVPQLQFFKNVMIEPKILDPKFSRGFGVSKLGTSGIVVVSTTPPGRENDPLAADQKVKEDQQKALDERRKSSPPNNESK